MLEVAKIAYTIKVRRTYLGYVQEMKYRMRR